MIMMKVERERVKLVKMTEDDDGYMDASPAERVSFVWELTAELWSLRGDKRAERRLQRDVTNLVRQRG